jgi:hypothetical protein
VLAFLERERGTGEEVVKGLGFCNIAKFWQLLKKESRRDRGEFGFFVLLSIITLLLFVI